MRNEGTYESMIGRERKKRNGEGEEKGKLTEICAGDREIKNSRGRQT